jgi:hypothetical protein
MRKHKTRRFHGRAPQSKQRSATRKQYGGDPELLALSHFLKDIKTEEEYDAMSREDQEKYEKTEVMPAISKVINETANAIGKDNRAYYATLTIKMFFLLKNIIAKNKGFRFAVVAKIAEFRKETAYPELQATLDKLEEMLKTLDIKDEFLNAVFNQDLEKLETMLPQVKIRAKELSVLSKFFNGSDEMFDILKKSGFTLDFLPSNHQQNLIYIQAFSSNMDQNKFRERLYSLLYPYASKVQELKSLFDSAIRLPESEYNFNLFKYLVETLAPTNVYLYYTFEFLLNFKDYQKVSIYLLDLLIEKNTTLENIVPKTIQWIYENQPEKLQLYFKRIPSNYCFMYFRSLTEAESPFDHRIIMIYIESMIEKGCHKSNYLLQFVVRKSLMEPLKRLLDTGDFKDMIDEVIDDAPTEEIRNLLLKYGKIQMWEGWTKSDASQFDFLFSDEGAINYSVCPVCLKFVARSVGCLYMSHVCASLPGFFHKRLYEMYAWSPDMPENNNIDDNDDNNQFGGASKKVTWCTDCGRICYGHQHYELGSATASTKPKRLPYGAPFDNDCRKTNGGGGYPEKVARYRRAREYALELQEDVGKISQKNALEDLVEQIWNAPLYKTRAVNRIIREKAWNIPTERFPNPKTPNSSANAANTTNAPNIQRPNANKNLVPTFSESGDNNVALESGIPVIYFHHRQPDGTVKDHEEGISLPTLINFVKEMNQNFGADLFGTCPLQCGARLHPDEVQKAFELFGDPQEALVAEYRAKFNRRFRA